MSADKRQDSMNIFFHIIRIYGQFIINSALLYLFCGNNKPVNFECQPVAVDNIQRYI